MGYWDLSYEVYCEWCAAKGDAPPTREWYDRWMTGEGRVMLDLKRARIEALCPVCFGCGRTSLDLFGREVPQPMFTSNSSTPVGWRTCSRCFGSGVLEERGEQ